MLDSNQLTKVLSTLASLKEDQSKSLGQFLAFHEITPAEFLGHLQFASQKTPDDRVLTQYKDLLLHLDNYPDGWLETQRCSRQRRSNIYEALGIEKQLREFSESECPFPSDIEQPTIIAEKAHHPDWYKAHGQNFYFSRYLDYLKKRKGYDTKALLGMEHSTKCVMELLADPKRHDIYQSKGLVVGYVQSGKTANFIGVSARAADAGYRLIIVLAGLTNILRHQSQRRIDKDLIGKDFCASDTEYSEDLPADWDQFIEHNIDTAPDHPKWERLTTIGDNGEYSRLGTNISRLQFNPSDKSIPLNDPINLHSLPVTLAVIKKSPQIIFRLIQDLKISGTKLNELPCLIIDDESDQASLNTASLPDDEGDKQERTETNKRIIELLSTLPRAQYVGYTATPYANALMNPEDKEDLFPKDFIISLEKPIGYMGVSDFFDDPEIPDEEKDTQPYLSKEDAFIRKVTGDDEKTENLKKAFSSFVISGAIKLYREKHAAGLSFPHHTMMIHTHHTQSIHDDVRELVKDTFNDCAFNTTKGTELLREEWEEYRKVSSVHGKNYPMPRSFDILSEYIGKCLDKIQSSDEISLLLNSSTASNDAPKWEEQDIWKIIIGGNKLSRGYTIEGLTVSYYRRRAKTADTIMQMGRWFGYRRGYDDLVRLYIGTEEQSQKKTINLLDNYRDLCTTEEDFRKHLKYYKKKDGELPVTPIDIPPLVSVVNNIQPTASNKRRHAKKIQINPSGRKMESTLAPTDPAKMSSNRTAAENLLKSANYLGEQGLGGTFSDPNISSEWRGFVWTTTPNEVSIFLNDYQWSKENNEPKLEAEFLRDEETSKFYSRFIILTFVNKRKSTGPEWLSKYKVFQRSRRSSDNEPFKAYTVKEHRAIAQYLAELSNDKLDTLQLKNANEYTKKMLPKDGKQGVLLLYPIREDESAEISIGFSIQHPENSLPYQLKYTSASRQELTE